MTLLAGNHQTEPVVRRDEVVRVIPTGPARPFFDTAQVPDSVGVLAPPDGLGGPETKAPDPLAWYALAAG